MRQDPRVEIELGAPAMKTVAIHVQRFGAGFRSVEHRTTANAVFTVVEGRGRTRIGEHDFHWQRGDILAVPAWQPYRHEVEEAAHLVRVSDEPVMRAFDFLRQR